MAASTLSKGKEVKHLESETSEDEDEEVEVWDDWNADEDDESETEFQCLFCNSLHGSCGSLFDHCSAEHSFDFKGLRKSLGLDFYGAFKLINYVRRKVAENRCWSCGLTFQSNQDLRNHLHVAEISKDTKLSWDDDKYLVPYLEEDSLLYSFDDDVEGEDDVELTSVDREELMGVCGGIADISIDQTICNGNGVKEAPDATICNGNGVKEVPFACNGSLHIDSSSKEEATNVSAQVHDDSDKEPSDKNLRVSFAKVAASEIRKVNDSYFGSYSSFGIHREMLSDKARMDAYSKAILQNPSLLNGAKVMDVGCGTGILSLFAAKAGASQVIAVDASQKMAAVATQIASSNGLLCAKNGQDISQHGVVQVFSSMVEELDKLVQIEPQSIDVLVSEWMGYCLLYESMLGSVLFARDKWLKPGGAILPDTATMFAAGFGRGATSLPFWENVYGFDMSSVGKELVEESAKFPIVDIVDGCDIVTETALLRNFDLVTMKLEDMDFTTTIELEPKPSNNLATSSSTWCHGVVLWFDTDFTTRFCKENPTVLSTSPYELKTHWSQTILTFKEPILLSSSPEELNTGRAGPAGTDLSPASKIQLRVSIVRSALHRAIDISLETTGVGQDGRKHHFPLQIFNLS